MRDFNALKFSRMRDFNMLKYVKIRNFNAMKYAKLLTNLQIPFCPLTVYEVNHERLNQKLSLTVCLYPVFASSPSMFYVFAVLDLHV